VGPHSLGGVEQTEVKGTGLDSALLAVGGKRRTDRKEISALLKGSRYYKLVPFTG